MEYLQKMTMLQYNFINIKNYLKIKSINTEYTSKLSKNSYNGQITKVFVVEITKNFIKNNVKCVGIES